jgi:hypothetical protein
VIDHGHLHPVFGCQMCIDRLTVASYETPEERRTRRERRRERDRERTQIQHAMIERGIHPATRHPLVHNGETCGTCGWFEEGHRGRYFKCSNPSGPGVTNGSATDIRKTWPACDLWKTP